MQRRPAAYLWDIREATSRIREFVGDFDASAFAESALVQAAVERQFEIIGEALNQLSRVAPEISARIPHAARIIAFRNILIHGYAVLDHTIVWSVIQEHLQNLEEAVRFLLTNGIAEARARYIITAQARAGAAPHPARPSKHRAAHPAPARRRGCAAVIR